MIVFRPSGALRFRIETRLDGRDSIKVTAQRVQGELPSIPLITHERLKNSQADGRLIMSQIIDGAGYGREMTEAGALGKEGADFNVGVDALLKTAEHLQHQLLSEHD